ncbi:MAG: hypothetical protein FWC67_01855, partial [Defluviitaleaceae bacterium]|nr:hypothetical protein [Defluviitaleaceae bacterium]
ERGGVETFVFDLRGNTGGYPLSGFQRLIRYAGRTNRELFGNIYVLVDGFTYSNGTVFADLWRRQVEDVVVMGAPTAGTLNFFAAAMRRTLPSSGIGFYVSTVAHFYDETTDLQLPLIPDIIVLRTLEDYINHHDAAIELIRQRAAQRRN